MAKWFSAPAPAVRRVRAYFASVDRQTQTPVLFDLAEQLNFNVDAPTAPWIDLGWIQGFVRKAQSKSEAILTGIPAAPLEQVRERLQAQVSFEFLSWTKLTMALATGAQHMNVLASGTGGQVLSAATVGSGSTSTFLVMSSADAARFSAGQIIAVDLDYAGETGYVGAPVSGAYLRQTLSDVDYIRRVTFNVGMVADVNSSGLTLQSALPGGVPIAGAKLQAVVGFVDREGGTFYQEWSALFVMEGSQGERIFFHYPRLQAMVSAEEGSEVLDVKHRGGYARVLLKAQFMALPVTDPLDGERVVCYRSFAPAVNAVI